MKFHKLSIWMLSKIKLGERPNCLRVNSTGSVLAGLKFISHRLAQATSIWRPWLIIPNVINIRRRVK